jgi:hypothetical protein
MHGSSGLLAGDTLLLLLLLQTHMAPILPCSCGLLAGDTLQQLLLLLLLLLPLPLLLQAYVSPHSVIVHGSCGLLAGDTLQQQLSPLVLPQASYASQHLLLPLMLLLQAHISPHSVMVHGSFGRLAGPVATFSILRTTSSPSFITRPKTTCLLSSQSAGLAQIKK